MNIAETESYVQAELTALPIATESMDLILCVHALENVLHPDAVIAEMHRVVKPGGKIIFFYFNSFGLWRFLYHHKTISTRKIKYFLREFNFDIISDQTICFRPPFHDENIAQRWIFLENFGQFFLSSCGLVSVLMVEKKTVSVTPLFSNHWKKILSSDATRLVEPS